MALPGPAGGPLAALLLALGAATAADRAWLLGRRAPRVLLLRNDSGSNLQTRDGRCFAIRSTERRAHRHWALVEVDDPARPRLLVAADMLPREQFRRLRLWVLWGKLPAQAGQ